MSRTYPAPHVAEAIGITPGTLYRTWRQRHDREGMPLPATLRPLGWEKSGFDYWLTRNHPLRAGTPANDMHAPLAPVTIAEHQRDLHDYYRRAADNAGGR